MGASLTMIDRHYGHLARDGRDHAIKLLDTFTRSEEANVHAVDVAWTLHQQVVAHRKTETVAEQRETEALFRTRTGDPLLTMEVLYQLS